MKKLLIFIGSVITLFYNTSCSSDDNDISENGTNNLNIKSGYSVNRLEVLEVIPSSSVYTNASFEWILKSKSSLQDSLIIKERNLNFISLYPGVYSVLLKIKNGNETIENKTYITVRKEKNNYSPYISKVYDFLPAVGQFTNTLPEWTDGNTREAMIIKAQNTISGEKPKMISLGGFGGYVVFGFDHTIININGKRDFKVLGNAFWSNSSERVGSPEPGIIMVSYDKNKNGIPDDEWYEIAGSEYYKNQTIKNYSITYYQPTKPESTEAISEYIKWEDNQGNSGYKSKNGFHGQSYYPEWVISTTLSFSGTKLANNYHDKYGDGSFWEGKSYEYGYADNAPNDDDASNIDIDWAVDKNGNKVKLPGINFVKVYTGINQEAGQVGEISTEVAGAYDLHLIK